jgi:uncharacterized protein YqfB (UPF0267 family)
MFVILADDQHTKMIISFPWTTQALLDGKKTVTRRDWPELHAKKFRVGAIVTAYDKQPCWGGRPMARIQIVSVRRESLNELYADPSYARAQLKGEGRSLARRGRIYRAFLESEAWRPVPCRVSTRRAFNLSGSKLSLRQTER